MQFLRLLSTAFCRMNEFIDGISTVCVNRMTCLFVAGFAISLEYLNVLKYEGFVSFTNGNTREVNNSLYAIDYIFIKCITTRFKYENIPSNVFSILNPNNIKNNLKQYLYRLHNRCLKGVKTKLGRTTNKFFCWDFCYQTKNIHSKSQK